MIKDNLRNQKDGFERAVDPIVVKTFDEFQDELEKLEMSSLLYHLNYQI